MMTEIKNDIQEKENEKINNNNSEINNIKEEKNNKDNKDSNNTIKDENESNISKIIDNKNNLEKNKNEDRKSNLTNNGYKQKENKEKKEKTVIFSEKVYNDQEILDIGIEIPKESPSDLIKIIKKDKHGQNLTNISYDYIFKVSLIGDSSTGKTSILMRFIDDCFKEDTLSTIGVDFKIVSFELDKNVYAKMQIWDTCGSERFKSLTSSFIKTCTAFILVFDLTRLSTFKSIDSWINIIKDNTSPKFLILIGNKDDLIELREVNKDIVLEFCRKNMFNYLEISAKNNTNIEKMFKEVAYQLYMDIKKYQKVKLKAYVDGGNFSNLQIQMDNKKEKEKNGCCS